MAGDVEGEKRLHRVTREEMYGTVGQPTESLRQGMSQLPSWIVDSFMRGAEHAGMQRCEVEFTQGGPVPQTLKLSVERAEGSGILRAIFEGNWSAGTEVPEGWPVRAGYEGKFFRCMKPGESRPIAEVSTDLKPGDPYGLAMVGKSNIWLLRADPKVFPSGGRITAFDQSNGINGADVKPGSTLLYIKPL